MRLFRYPEDRWPISIFVCLFAADVAVYSVVDSWPLLAAWTLLGILPKGHICAWNHHHQHLSVFEVPIFNRLLELVYALQTGVSSHAWVLHHSVGHHVNYLDQRDDESRWQRDDGSTMGEIEYSLEVALTAYPRAWQVSRRFPRYRVLFLTMGLITLGILAALLVARPVPALFVFVLPMLISLFITAWATYSHHSGKSTASHFSASNNILHRGYNLLTGNLGFHTAHHYRPGVHWSRLPALHAEVAANIPTDCYLTPGFPWTLGQSSASAPEDARDLALDDGRLSAAE